MTNLFKGRTLVIVTKHKKENVLAPLFEKHLGVECITIENFDTDQFGTFTNEIKRDGNQLEAARRKLLAGLKHAKADLGISSEGSFHPNPSFPWLTRNLELCLLIDLKNNIEARGHSQSMDGIPSPHEIQDTNSTLELIGKWGFPEQGVIIKEKRWILKDKIHKDFCDLNKIHEFLTNKKGVPLIIEPDFRAHLNPKRMQTIKEAGFDLIRVLNQTCQSCKHMPLEYTGTSGRLECTFCKIPSNQHANEKWTCPKCKKEHLLKRKDGKKNVQPAECNYCNP